MAGARAYGGGRSTAQRRALAEAAQRFVTAFTVEELADSASRGGGPRPSLATAYRAVASMTASGFLERVGERDGKALYARCAADGHHHHLVCTSCGAVAEAACPLGTAAGDEAARAGFVLTGHDVVLYGLCETCAAGG